MRSRRVPTVVAFFFILGNLSAALAHAAESSTRKATLVGVVLPNDVRPGERASGSILLYPGAVAGISGLHVEKTRIDLDTDQPRKAVLKGVVIDAGLQPRPAEQDFVVDVPPTAKSVHLIVSRDEQQISAIDVPIEASTTQPLTCGSDEWVSGTEQDGSKSQFRTPATYCYAGMAVIAGTFNGDGEQTEVDTGGGTRARVIGESVRYCYFLLPSTIMPGPNKITLHEGTHVVTFEVAVPRMDLMQVLEEGGGSVAEAPRRSRNEGNPDAAAIPLGIGIGVGSSMIGGGEEEPGWRRR